ncbi:cobalt-precorrin-5B (C(1))-methyltransferase CbiD [Desulfoluna butyratoxydans]|uniref:Cobalt-precorrin-5B C(1)-methyltransferase n=1 Tax=Desulfoluna butyratoxydans TaxID=231438 RepID=A0A4U8YUI7_9BACT|nr:cobalt-precorrin-5B (C(1))-methyltransferase CbiD [Desulfoluna butyratoxydans]VFQ47247.1 cobalt-precorrin-5b c(1)-methyltransferase cbid [Desulfoluna butyratoxydans]
MAKKRTLRNGFTTGTAAAAAVKGALSLLFTGVCPEKVRIAFLSEGHVDIPLVSCEMDGETAVCTVMKDGGDDPDITRNAIIGARVRREEAAEDDLVICGGQGVGRVTRPGLEVPVGQAAINPGPVKMIRAVVEMLRAETGESDPLVVEIFVPDGEEMAKKTLNSRLGIEGGISILGTTGIERPLSHEAYEATVRSSIKVAKAMGAHSVVCTTGRRSERFAMEVFPERAETCFVQIGDFFKSSMETAGAQAMDVILAVFFGKAVKMAAGIPHTHAAKSDLNLRFLADLVEEMVDDPELVAKVAASNTAREAFTYLAGPCPQVVDRVAELAAASAKGFAGGEVTARCLIFDFDGNVASDSRKETV